MLETINTAKEKDVNELYDYVKNHVRKHYGGLQEADQEDIIQGTVVHLLLILDQYDPNRGPFDSFLSFHVRTSAIRAYRDLFNTSAHVQKRVKETRVDLDAGLSIEEIAKKHGYRKSTVCNYTNLAQKPVSLDAKDLDGRDLYSKLADNTEHPSIELDLSGWSEMDRFIAETYIKNAGERAWKKRTVAECAKYGISKKKTVEIMRKVREEKIRQE